jgi:hypothetical protein
MDDDLLRPTVILVPVTHSMRIVELVWLFDRASDILGDISARGSGPMDQKKTGEPNQTVTDDNQTFSHGLPQWSIFTVMVMLAGPTGSDHPKLIKTSLDSDLASHCQGT